jgi:hypothetical protein
MLRERFLANSLGFKPLKLNVRIEATCLDLHEKGTCERRAKVPGNRNKGMVAPAPFSSK